MSKLTDIERNCPLCGAIISYSNKYKKQRADNWNSVCVECRIHRRRENRKLKGDLTDLDVVTRNCPKCNKLITYSCNSKCRGAIERNSLCHECAGRRVGSSADSIEKRKQYYQSHPEAIKQIIKRTHTKEANQKRISSMKKLCASDEKRKQLSENSKAAWKNPNSKLNSVEYRKFHRELTLKAQKASGGAVSKKELELKELIECLGFKHNRKFILNSIPDFVHNEKKLIVELFGDYYHANPDVAPYSDPEWVNPTTKKRSLDTWERDSARIKALESEGYSILIVWESELRKNEVEVFERVKKFILLFD